MRCLWICGVLAVSLWDFSMTQLLEEQNTRVQGVREGCTLIG